MKAGFHPGFPAARYHADPCARASLSASIAHTLIARSPLHAWFDHPKLNPELFEREAERRFDVGTAAHALLLEGRHAVEVVDADSWRSKAAKEAGDEARAAGKIPLLADQWERVVAMVHVARSQALAVNVQPPIFRNGQAETMIVWHEGNVTCRALIDWLHDDHTAIDDYKTTGVGGPDAWTTRTMYGIGADIQVAFYLRGIERLTGKRPAWRYVVQETEPPYALFVVSPTPAVIEIANAKVERAIELWRTCTKTGVWPGYPTELCWAEMPPWEEARWLEREAREAA